MYNPVAPTTSNIPVVTPTKNSKLKSLGKPFGIILITTVLYILSIIIATVISTQSTVSAFDGTSTIAYILVYYALNHYYELSKKQGYYYLLFALFLSLTVVIVEGSILLILLPPVLKKLKLIDSNL